jgi:hypothetical protein
MLISGWAIRYGTPYRHGGPDRPTCWTEVVERGAADVTARFSTITLDVHHEAPPLASTRNDSLQVWSDSTGVFFAAELDHGWSEFGVDVDAIERQVAAGELCKASWQGSALAEVWEDWDGNEADPYTAPVCRILVLELMAVTLTDTPANPATSAKAECTQAPRPAPGRSPVPVAIEYGDEWGDNRSAATAEMRLQYATGRVEGRSASPPRTWRSEDARLRPDRLVIAGRDADGDVAAVRRNRPLGELPRASALTASSN